MGERILLARLELSATVGEKVSQEDLGIVVGHKLGKKNPVTAATVSRWESGDAMPSLATVQAIAEACRVDPGWLAFGDRSKAPSPRDRFSDPREAELHEVALRILRQDAEFDNVVQNKRKELAQELRRIRTKLQELRTMPDGPARVAAIESLLGETAIVVVL